MNHDSLLHDIAGRYPIVVDASGYALRDLAVGDTVTKAIGSLWGRHPTNYPKTRDARTAIVLVAPTTIGNGDYSDSGENGTVIFVGTAAAAADMLFAQTGDTSIAGITLDLGDRAITQASPLSHVTVGNRSTVTALPKATVECGNRCTITAADTVTIRGGDGVEIEAADHLTARLGHNARIVVEQHAKIVVGDGANIRCDTNAVVHTGDWARLQGTRTASAYRFGNNPRVTLDGETTLNPTDPNHQVSPGLDGLCRIIAGNNAQFNVPDRVAITAGGNLEATAGSWCNIAGGDRSTITAQYVANVAAGDESTVTVGDGARITVGDRSTIICGAKTQIGAGSATRISATTASVFAGDNIEFTGQSIDGTLGTNARVLADNASLVCGDGAIIAVGGYGSISAGERSVIVVNGRATVKAGPGSNIRVPANGVVNTAAGTEVRFGDTKIVIPDEFDHRWCTPVAGVLAATAGVTPPPKRSGPDLSDCFNYTVGGFDGT